MVFVIGLHKCQIEHVLASDHLRLIEWHNLLLNHDVKVKFGLNDVCRNLADDLLECDISLQSLIKVLFQEWFS